MLSLWRAPLRARPPLGCVRCGCVGGYGAPSSWCRRVSPTGGSDGRPGGVHAKHTSVTMGRTPQTCGYTSTEKATRRTDGRAVSSGRDAEEDGGMRGDHPDRRGVTAGIGTSFLALSRPTPMAGAIPARLPVAATWAPLLTPRPRLVPPSPATLPSDRWLWGSSRFHWELLSRSRRLPRLPLVPWDPSPPPPPPPFPAAADAAAAAASWEPPHLHKSAVFFLLCCSWHPPLSTLLYCLSSLRLPTLPLPSLHHRDAQSKRCPVMTSTNATLCVPSIITSWLVAGGWQPPASWRISSLPISDPPRVALPDPPPPPPPPISTRAGSKPRRCRAASRRSPRWR